MKKSNTRVLLNIYIYVYIYTSMIAKNIESACISHQKYFHKTINFCTVV